MFEGKVFLITGGGSLGESLIGRLLELNPKAIRVLDNSEHALFKIQQRFPDARNIRHLLGDITDYDRVEFAMEGTNYVIHTAANKFVDLISYNPFQALNTNINGTINVIKAAMKTQSVEKAVYTSSDKAVEPASIYGNSKAIGEHLFSWANRVSDKIFTTVRLPNLLRSRGAVFDIWQRQKSEGKPLSITNERMERYFLPMEDAVGMILKALEVAKGGEIFLPANVEPQRVVDLAREVGSNLKIVGVRSGEKIVEKLMSSEEEKRAVRIGSMWAIK
ncbi:MAG: polysaccharide biosynthesis protein [Desulfobacterales bacterium]|nr:polysaccharide biosynthesis protein [Desulfobacterales bacterium]